MTLNLKKTIFPAIFLWVHDCHLPFGECFPTKWRMELNLVVSKVFPGFRIAVYFFFSFIFISWRLTTLQYCSGFCHTLTWISHGFTCVPHPDPPSHLPPLWVFPVHQPWALVSCIQPELVICFTLDSTLVKLLCGLPIDPTQNYTKNHSAF